MTRFDNFSHSLMKALLANQHQLHSIDVNQRCQSILSPQMEENQRHRSIHLKCTCLQAWRSSGKICNLVASWKRRLNTLTYHGKTRYRQNWMNHSTGLDIYLLLYIQYVPGPSHALSAFMLLDDFKQAVMSRKCAYTRLHRAVHTHDIWHTWHDNISTGGFTLLANMSPKWEESHWTSPWHYNSLFLSVIYRVDANDTNTLYFL